MARTKLRTLLAETDSCFVAPCVYDCASARAVEMVGFKAAWLSGGEVALSFNGVPDYGFNDLATLESIVSRITQTVSIPLGVDVDNGFGGPLSVYRMARRMAMMGAQAIQMEDAADLQVIGSLLPREDFYAKVRAAVAGLAGTDCLLVARTHGYIAGDMDEACERMARAHELGAEMTMIMQQHTIEEAAYISARVPGWKIFPDIGNERGVPDVRVEELSPLGYSIATIHYTMKAAFDGMLEHGLRNMAAQNSFYTATKKDSTGVMGESATPLFDTKAYMDLEARFTGTAKEFHIGRGSTYPEEFVRPPIEDRL
jgi:methylisocitrate lyase